MEVSYSSYFSVDYVDYLHTVYWFLDVSLAGNRTR